MLCKWGDGDVLHPVCIGVSVPPGAETGGTWVDGSMEPPSILTTACVSTILKTKGFILKREAFGSV